jgi:transcriptional pleiotropic regulator of transition state genes
MLIYIGNIKIGVIIVKATGILRRVDEMGRVVIPKELRESLELKSEDSIEIFVENDKIVLQKYEKSCLFCDNTDNIIIYMGKRVCNSCLEEMDNA